MSSVNDFIKRLEDHEHGTSRLEAEELVWYNHFVDGVSAVGELELKNELEEYYQEHVEKKSSKVIQLWSAVGIAAMLALGGVYFSTTQSASDSIQLQTNEAPIFSDSATYDSTNNKLEKKSENDVDK